MTPEEPTRPLNAYRGFAVRLPTGPPEHRPMQPTWVCANCSEAWPCEPARKQLLADGLSRTELGVTMYGYLEDFLIDQGNQMKGSFERFISWTREPGQ